jgi:protein O-GlcNAc transferase
MTSDVPRKAPVGEATRPAPAHDQAGLPQQAVDPLPAQLSPLLQSLQQGRHAQVEALAATLGKQFPRSALVLHVLGASRLVRQLHREGYEALSRASELAPGEPQILNLLGVALFKLGRHEAARDAFDRSLARDPRNYETLVNASANALGATDGDAAARLAESALAVRPNGVEAIFALANAASARGREEEAVALYRRAIAIDPRAPDLHLNLGIVLASLHRRTEAAEALRQALSLRPNYALAHLNLGRVLHDLGETGEAQRHFRAASDLDPNMTEAHSAYLFSLAHDERISPQQSFAEHVRVGDLIEAPLRHLPRRHDNDRDPERELRIGFVSGDLLDHPVANFIDPLWRAMKGGRFRIHAYSNRFSDDPVAARLRALADEWVQVERMSDEELCERIRADRIDILVDLSGHSARHRLPVFARKPAPLQVSWIGYPGTTGLAAMDYRFARALNSGDPLDELFREKLIYFRSRSFRPEAGAPDVNPLPALSTGALTFASFSRPSKIGEAVISLWSQVLLAVPDSTLLIAGMSDAGLEDRFRAAFGARGIAPERLSFRPRLPLLQYLALHHEVDVVLDTFPYSGGTTAYHALWMGVPLLTLAGLTLQQNQSSLIMKAVGLSDWIVESPDAYVARARAAAADLPALARLRSGLRERARVHFEGSLDESRAGIDAAFRSIWRRWCAGQEPASITLSV